MELEYSDKNSRRSKVYIAVGVIVALLVAATVYIALQASGLTDQGEVEMRQVVVAAVEIPGRKTIEETDVVMRNVPVDPISDAALVTLEDALGRIVAVPITAGQLITPNLLASTDQGATFSILRPGEEFSESMPDLRAVSMTVPDDRAVGGTLQPGQPVDLIATVGVTPGEDQTGEGEGEEGEEPSPDATPKPVAGPSTKTTFQRMDILVRNGSLYILRTDLETAEKITELQAAGAQFTFVLRADEDERTAETEGSTLDRLLEEFGFPAPEEAELSSGDTGP
ncbi:MAG: flagella basal body P-ring formation protein FlgA [Chloroflexota bacterium]|nr:flagella basal body P-ring formation protein FlgA [Chloroflexota bacterium]